MNNYDADNGRPQYEQNSREWQLAVIEVVEHELNEYLTDKRLIPIAVLYFGSFIRGETKLNGLSDVDVFILAKDPPPSNRQGGPPQMQTISNNEGYELMRRFNLSHISFQATTRGRAVSSLSDLNERVKEDPQIIDKVPGSIYTILKNGITARGELPEDIISLVQSIDQTLAQQEEKSHRQERPRILSLIRGAFGKK